MCSRGCGGKKSGAKKIGVARPTATRQTYSASGTSTYGKPRIKFGTRSR